MGERQKYGKYSSGNFWNFPMRLRGKVKKMGREKQKEARFPK
jgi:hypothetical protein